MRKMRLKEESSYIKKSLERNRVSVRLKRGSLIGAPFDILRGALINNTYEKNI